MLKVTNGGFFSKNITQQRLTRVARAGLTVTEPQTTDDSRNMGPLDTFSDHYLCANAKKLALEALHEMARNSALLDAELGKNGREKNGILINTYMARIRQSKKKLGNLMPGRSIEFGSRRYFPVIGKQSYLICRDANRLHPTGIAVFEPPPPVRYSARQAELIPFFITPDLIRFRDLEAIRECAKINCREITYTVRHTDEDEPILMCDSSNTGATEVQKRLSDLWIKFRAHQELTSLNSIQFNEFSLVLITEFQDHGDQQYQDEANLYIEERWNPSAIKFAAIYRAACEQIQGPVRIDYVINHADISALFEIDFPTRADKEKLENLKKSNCQLRCRIKKMEMETGRIRDAFGGLTDLINQCHNLDLIDIFRSRMALYAVCLKQFSDSDMNVEGQQDLFNVVRIQDDFVANFNPGCIRIFDTLMNPPGTEESFKFGITPPRSLPLQNELIASLRDPRQTFKQVQAAMLALRDKQDRLLETQIIQKDLAWVIHGFLVNIRVEYLSGEGEDSGLSYFQPEVYARFISLKTLVSDLLNQKQRYKRVDLTLFKQQFNTHRTVIQHANEGLLDENSKFGWYFNKPKRYFPNLSKSGRPVTYEEWEVSHKSRKTPVRFLKRSPGKHDKQGTLTTNITHAAASNNGQQTS